jgi:hypothetical protein
MRTTLIIAVGALVMVGPGFAATSGGGGGSSGGTSTAVPSGSTSGSSGSTSTGSAGSGSGGGHGSSGGGGGGGGHIGGFGGGARGAGGYGVTYVSGGHMGAGPGTLVRSTVATGPASHSAAMAIRVEDRHSATPNPHPHPRRQSRGLYSQRYNSICAASGYGNGLLCATSNLYCDGSELFDIDLGADYNLLPCPRSLKTQDEDSQGSSGRVSVALSN